MPSVEVWGADEAVARLAQASAVAQMRIREDVKKAATDTNTLAKRLCPVDTGRLRSSIATRSFNGWMGAEVYTDVEYAAYVEFGTINMQAEPYLGPAWEAIRPYYLADIVETLRTCGELRL